MERIDLEWRGPLPPDVPAAEQAVRADVQELAPTKPSNLVFHVCQLGADLDGPTVLVHGDKDRPVFICRYSEVTEWDGFPKGVAP